MIRLFKVWPSLVLTRYNEGVGSTSQYILCSKYHKFLRFCYNNSPFAPPFLQTTPSPHRILETLMTSLHTVFLLNDGSNCMKNSYALKLSLPPHPTSYLEERLDHRLTTSQHLLYEGKLGPNEYKPTKSNNTLFCSLVHTYCKSLRNKIKLHQQLQMLFIHHYTSSGKINQT